MRSSGTLPIRSVKSLLFVDDTRLVWTTDGEDNPVRRAGRRTFIS